MLQVLMILNQTKVALVRHIFVKQSMSMELIRSTVFGFCILTDALKISTRAPNMDIYKCTQRGLAVHQKGLHIYFGSVSVPNELILFLILIPRVD